jgi:hypothetical protein
LKSFVRFQTFAAGASMAIDLLVLSAGAAAQAKPQANKDAPITIADLIFIALSS